MRSISKVTITVGMSIVVVPETWIYRGGFDILVTSELSGMHAVVWMVIEMKHFFVVNLPSQWDHSQSSFRAHLSKYFRESIDINGTCSFPIVTFFVFKQR
jgi:hypothetical protein